MNHDDLLDPRELLLVLRKLNSMRRQDQRSPMEEDVDALFGSANRLAVYGSLAPGESNHRELAGLPGEWTQGYVTGELHDRGWAASQGYPGLCWDPDSTHKVEVKVFTSPALVGCWGRLDAFEGEGYQRILVPVHETCASFTVANLYEVRQVLPPLAPPRRTTDQKREA